MESYANNGILNSIIMCEGSNMYSNMHRCSMLIVLTDIVPLDDILLYILA